MPVDTTLVRKNGRYVPKAVTADLDFSADGSGSLASLARDTKVGGKRKQRRFSIKWAHKLGVPEVSGDTLTWRNVAPGADLVVRAQARGFVHFVVFHRRPTGPVDADGQLTAQAAPNGLTSTTTYDSTGKQTSLTYNKAGNTWLTFTATTYA